MQGTDARALKGSQILALVFLASALEVKELDLRKTNFCESIC